MTQGTTQEKRMPLRLQKAFDNYEIKTGSAGFVQLIKNGKRIQPKHFALRFNVRKKLS